MAEDGSGESILRVYEAEGAPAEAFIALPRSAEVWETDMLENNGTRLVGQGRELRVAFRPHEIKTLRIRFQP
jgi:alpha-mannosidase